MGIALINVLFITPKNSSSHYFLYYCLIINCFFFDFFKFQRFFVHTKHAFFFKNFREECARHTRRHTHAT